VIEIRCAARSCVKSSKGVARSAIRRPSRTSLFATVTGLLRCLRVNVSRNASHSARGMSRIAQVSNEPVTSELFDLFERRGGRSEAALLERFRHGSVRPAEAAASAAWAKMTSPVAKLGTYRSASI
jgi:hypothetical protein